MTSQDEEYIEVLYNTCYGGYGISETAIKEYNKRKKEIDPLFQEISYDFFSILGTSRDDTTLIEIFKEMGNKFNDKYAKIKIKKIPKKYKNFYEISEYDGKESIHINNHSFVISSIKKILYNDTPSDEKIKKIKEILVNEKMEEIEDDEMLP